MPNPSSFSVDRTSGTSPHGPEIRTESATSLCSVLSSSVGGGGSPSPPYEDSTDEREFVVRVLKRRSRGADQRRYLFDVLWVGCLADTTPTLSSTTPGQEHLPASSSCTRSAGAEERTVPRQEPLQPLLLQAQLAGVLRSGGNAGVARNADAGPEALRVGDVVLLRGTVRRGAFVQGLLSCAARCSTEHLYKAARHGAARSCSPEDPPPPAGTRILARADPR